MSLQKTIQTAVQAKGIGVHSGTPVTLQLRPAPINTGIVFHRTDLVPVASVPAHADYACHSPLCTSLQDGDVKINTVEHLLSALAGMGIDNLHIDIDAAELPIMDGSAYPFVFLLQSAGIQEQSAPKAFIRITKPVELVDGEKCMALQPFDGFVVDFSIDYTHPAFTSHNQNLHLDFRYASYERDIARARTFGFMQDYAQLKKQNYAQGSSLDNTVAFDASSILNEEGLRYENECVKHKVLDLIGDLYLLGSPILASVRAVRSGHQMNAKLVQNVLSNPDCYEQVMLQDGSYVPLKIAS